jgi:hypothetical protein
MITAAASRRTGQVLTGSAHRWADALPVVPDGNDGVDGGAGDRVAPVAAGADVPGATEALDDAPLDRPHPAARHVPRQATSRTASRRLPTGGIGLLGRHDVRMDLVD